MSVILDLYDQIRIKLKILNAIHSAFNDVQKSEPELVANLAYYIPERLNGVTLGHVSFLVGSVFIHQKPYVKNISNPSSWKSNYVELGDLLLINNLVENNEIIQRTALLMQAKKFSKNTKNSIKPDNPDQLDLYSNWPKFEYIRCPQLNGQKRYIDCKKETDIFNGAKYLLINKSKGLFGDYVSDPTMPTLTRFKPFHCELFDFITGNAGKEFVQLGCRSGDIGWSRVIYDLIYNISSQRLSRKIAKNLPTPKKNRGFGYRYGDFSDKYGFVIQQLRNVKKYYSFSDRINADKENIGQPIVDEKNNNFGDNGINADEENNGFTIIEITTVINSDNKNDNK